jgi:hypothetical protein
MGKLHELLASEPDKEMMAKLAIDEAKTTFAKKGTHFEGHTKTLQMRNEDRQFEEAAGFEHKELVDTVESKLHYVFGMVAPWYDAVLQKEKSNQEACADLVVKGQTIATDLPATFLLGMETKLKQLRDTLVEMPTLPPGIEWALSPDSGEGVFKAAHADVRDKTERKMNFKTVAEATKEHPAQVAQVEEVEIVGKFVTERISGMITAARKAQILKNVADLIQAVKAARQRANGVQASNDRVAESLFNYLLA